jgi:hypothetical protein
MTDRKVTTPRAPGPGRAAKPATVARGQALADATARVSDQSGRLVGEDSLHATREDVAHWIAVYSELLSFKAELLQVTARWRLTMSDDARSEADDDEVVLGAQADKYTRRLREWRAHPRGATGADRGGLTDAASTAAEVERVRTLLEDATADAQYRVGEALAEAAQRVRLDADARIAAERTARVAAQSRTDALIDERDHLLTQLAAQADRDAAALAVAAAAIRAAEDRAEALSVELSSRDGVGAHRSG